ncbi:MAG TPA: queuosine salvage family protein [Ktedonobacterales bacterium]
MLRRSAHGAAEQREDVTRMSSLEAPDGYLVSKDFTPPARDRLGVLTATARVMREATLVRISRPAVERLAVRWADAEWPATVATVSELHQPGPRENIPNWVLLLDALNFCFWGPPDGPRWRVTWHGATHDGYNALAAALSRAVEEQQPVADAAWLADLEGDTLAHVLRPDEGAPAIPLFAERLNNAREVGRVLLDRYDGRFINAIEDADYDAVALEAIIARDFSSFADIAEWRGAPVPFLKRAQILVSDLRALTGGAGAGAILGMEYLTAFADYKLPQRLRALGVLEYVDSLARTVDSLTLITAGTEPEIEIRAATIWAVEALRRALAARGATRTASAIDERLWIESQTRLPDERPYHRTRTIYY